MAHSETYIKGVHYPSVTQILGIIRKPFLETWRGKWGNRLCDKKLKAAGAIGTLFHSSVELLAQGVGVNTTNRRVNAMAGRMKEWLAEHEYQPEVAEFKVLSKKHKYSGTLDAIGYVKDFPGELVILDWKSGAGIYPEMSLQLAAYAEAYREQTGIAIKRGLIVQVSKDKPQHKLKTKEYDLTPKLFTYFKAARLLYDFTNQSRIKNRNRIPEPRIFRDSTKAA